MGLIVSIIYIVPIFFILKNALKKRKIRKSRIAIIIICLLNIFIGLSQDSEYILLIILITFFMLMIIVFANIYKGINEKQARDFNNMHLFDEDEN